MHREKFPKVIYSESPTIVIETFEHPRKRRRNVSLTIFNAFSKGFLFQSTTMIRFSHLISCFSRSKWLILSVFYFLSASFAIKNEFICSIVMYSVAKKERKVRKSFFHAWLISDLKIYLQVFLFSLLSSTFFHWKTTRSCAPFLCENLFHLFPFHFISFSNPTPYKARQEREREILCYKSFLPSV